MSSKGSHKPTKEQPINTDPSSPLTDGLKLERETLGKPWRDALDGALQSPSFQELKAFLVSERKRG